MARKYHTAIEIRTLGRELGQLDADAALVELRRQVEYANADNRDNVVQQALRISGHVALAAQIQSHSTLLDWLGEKIETVAPGDTSEPDDPEPWTYEDRLYEKGPDGDFAPTEEEVDRGVLTYYDRWIGEQIDVHPEWDDMSPTVVDIAQKDAWARHWREWAFEQERAERAEISAANTAAHEAARREEAMEIFGTPEPTEEQLDEHYGVTAAEAAIAVAGAVEAIQADSAEEEEAAIVRAVEALTAVATERQGKEALTAETSDAEEESDAEEGEVAFRMGDDLFDAAGKRLGDDGRPKKKYRLQSVRDMIENPELMKPTEKISPWLGYKGKVTLFWGREKTGKSTIATWDAAQATAQGRKVLWVSFEESENTMAQRFADVPHLDVDRLSVARVEEWEGLEEAVEDYEPDMVVIDSLTSAIGALEGKPPDTSQSTSWGAIVLKFSQLAQVDKRDVRAVVVLGHAKKDGSDYAGSHGIGSMVDMLVSNKVERSGGRTLIFRGRFDAEPIGTMYDEETGEIKVTTKASRWYDSELKVVEALREHGPMSREKLRDLVKMRRSRSKAVVDALLERGVLAEPKKGRLELTDAANEFDDMPDDLDVGGDA